MEAERTNVSRVKSDTDSNKLAGYLAHIFEQEEKEYHLNCIGPAAVNQATKAVATAIGMLAPKRIDIASRPSYFITKTDGRSDSEESADKTGVCLSVFRY